MRPFESLSQRSFAVTLAIGLAATFVPLEAAADLPLYGVVVDYEVGPAYVFRNDGRYGAAGTDYGAEEMGQQRVLVLTQRPSLELVFGERHTALFVYAPVRLVTRVKLARSLTFEDTPFPAGALVEHRYQFDGYRGSYLYSLLQTRRWRLDAGVSLQIRSAEVELTQLDSSSGLHANESSIGPVPALKLRLRYDAAFGVYAQLDADGVSRLGLGEGDGELLDAALTLGFPMADAADVFFRLRVYGGGAEVPDRALSNSAWFGIASAGLRTDIAQLFR